MTVLARTAAAALICASAVAAPAGAGAAAGGARGDTSLPLLATALPALPDTDYDVPAGAVHVAPDGGDAGAGTPSRPLSLERAVRSAPAGATIVMHGGTYRVDTVTLTKRLVLQPAPRARVWLKGSEVVEGWRREGRRWCAAWDRPLPRPSWEEPERYLDPERPLANRREQVFVDGRELLQVARPDDVRAGRFAVDPEARRLCVGTDPTRRTVESTAHRHGVALWSDRAAGSVVRGVGFAHYAESGLQVNAPRVVVEGVTATQNAVAGLNVNRASDVVVRGSRLVHNGRKGLGANRTDRLLVDRTLISDNNAQGFATNWDAAGAKITVSEDVVVRRSTVRDNRSMGLWLDINMRDARVTGNRLEGNRGFGVFFEISSRAVIADNLSIGNGAGIAVANSDGARLYNNTLVDNVTNILVKENADREPRAAELAAGASYVTERTEIVNNVFVAGAARRTDRHLYVWRWPCSPRPLVSTMHGNSYRTEGDAPTELAKLMPVGSRCPGAGTRVTQPASVADLRRLGFERAQPAVAHPVREPAPEPPGGAGPAGTPTASGTPDPAEQHGPAGSAPVFVDPAGGDYRLAPGSPLKGRGSPLPEVVATAVGAAASRAPVDVGVLTVDGSTSEVVARGDEEPDRDLPSDPTSDPAAPGVEEVEGEGLGAAAAPVRRAASASSPPEGGGDGPWAVAAGALVLALLALLGLWLRPWPGTRRDGAA